MWQSPRLSAEEFWILTFYGAEGLGSKAYKKLRTDKFKQAVCFLVLIWEDSTTSIAACYSLAKHRLSATRWLQNQRAS